MQRQNSMIEYMGELLPDGHLSVPTNIFRQIQAGQKVKVRLEICMTASEISKSSLKDTEDRMGDNLTMSMDLKGNYYEMLHIADQDWSDWLSPDEDIYEEYRKYGR